MRKYSEDLQMARLASDELTAGADVDTSDCMHSMRARGLCCCCCCLLAACLLLAFWLPRPLRARDGEGVCALEEKAAQAGPGTPRERTGRR